MVWYFKFILNNNEKNEICLFDNVFFASKVYRKSIGVKNLQEVKEISKSLIWYADEIKLCGAFGKVGANEII